MARRLGHVHDHPHRRIAGRRGRIREHHVDGAEHPQPVQVALRQVQLILAKPVPRPDREHAAHRPGVHLLRTRDQHLPHAHARPGKRLECRHGAEGRDVHIVVAEDVGVRVAEVLEPAHDRVGRRLEQGPVERVTDMERQVALQALHIEDRVETEHVQLGELHGIALVDAELDVRVPALAAHQRVDHRIHVPALTVQQQQPHDVAPELELVEVPLFPEKTDPPEIPLGRERA